MNKKRLKLSARFEYPVKIEARLPDFEPFASLKSLDLELLSKGNHKIEVGFFRGGCCRKLVRAIIRKGVVTGLEVEPCENTKRASPELTALLKEARRQVLPNGEVKWQPISVRDFMGNTAQRIVIGGGCILICIYGYCLMCCWRGAGRIDCYIPDIYTGPL